MAITLDTIVSDYLTALKAALTTGTDTGDPGAYAGDVHAAAQNYLRASDLATALELLQEALSAPIVTATGGSATTFIDSGAPFVAGEQVGNVVTITGDAGAGSIVVGETSVVVSNDTTTLTVSPAFSTAVTLNDTISITAAFLNTEIANLRKGGVRADSTVEPYGTQRDAINGLMRAVEQLGGSLAERNIGASTLVALDGSDDTVVLLSGGPYRIDQFKGMRVAVNTAGEGIAVSSNENSVTLRGPMAASAAADDAVTITVPINDFGGTSAPKIVTHPGSQPGENRVLADFIDQLQTLVEAATVPS